LSLFTRYGVEIPADPWPGKVTRYESVAEACSAGVDAEVEIAARYDRLLAGTDRPGRHWAHPRRGCLQLGWGRPRP
jgi:hypothetical protein